MKHDKEYLVAVCRTKNAEASLAFFLCAFGDELAEKEGYGDLNGIEAVRYYLLQKHNWLPRDIYAMSDEDLRFCLTKEMAGWKAPKEAVAARNEALTSEK